MDTEVMACASCGKKLSVPRVRQAGEFVCPDCNAPVPGPPRISRTSGARTGRKVRPPGRRGPPPGRRAPQGSYSRRRRSAAAPVSIGGIALILLIVGVKIWLRSDRADPKEPFSPFPRNEVQENPVSKEVVRTTLENIAAGRHPAGTLVEFPGVVVPVSLVEVSGGRQRTPWYVLATVKGGGYLERLSEIAGRVDRFLSRDLGPLKKATADGTATEEMFQELERLLKDLDGMVRFRPGEPMIAMGIKEFHSVARQIEWEQVVGDKPPWMQPPEHDWSDLYGGRVPELDPVEEEEFDVVEWLDETHVDLLSLMSVLRRIVNAPQSRLHAVVEERNAIVAQVFLKDDQPSPPAFVCERGPSEGAFARTFYATTDVLVTSIPAGALVEVGGLRMGRTPLIVPDLKPGVRLEMTVSLKGHETQNHALEVTLTPDCLLGTNVRLWPKEE